MNFRTVVLMREKKKEIKRSFPRAGLIKVKNSKWTVNCTLN